MKYRQRSEVLHETKVTLKGNEPFLFYRNARMIVNLSQGSAGSHNFFEDYVGPFPNAQKGDVLAFQIVRLSQIKMTWRERVGNWIRGKK